MAWAGRAGDFSIVRQPLVVEIAQAVHVGNPGNIRSERLEHARTRVGSRSEFDQRLARRRLGVGQHIEHHGVRVHARRLPRAADPKLEHQAARLRRASRRRERRRSALGIAQNRLVALDLLPAVVQRRTRRIAARAAGERYRLPRSQIIPARARVGDQLANLQVGTLLPQRRLVELNGQASAQPVVTHSQVVHINQRQRHEARQIVGTQVCTHLRQPAQRRRNRPRQLVAVQIQRRQLRQTAQLRRNRPRQGVAVQIQRRQLRQTAQLRRNRPRQGVAVQIQRRQLRQTAQLRWNRPRQGVVTQIQARQLRQPAKLTRDRRPHVVAAQVQNLQRRQPTQRTRQLAQQADAAQVQLLHPPVPDGDAGPLGGVQVHTPVQPPAAVQHRLGSKQRLAVRLQRPVARTVGRRDHRRRSAGNRLFEAEGVRETHPNLDHLALLSRSQKVTRAGRAGDFSIVRQPLIVIVDQCRYPVQILDAPSLRGQLPPHLRDTVNRHQPRRRNVAQYQQIAIHHVTRPGNATRHGIEARVGIQSLAAGDGATPGHEDSCRRPRQCLRPHPATGDVERANVALSHRVPEHQLAGVSAAVVVGAHFGKYVTLQIQRNVRLFKPADPHRDRKVERQHHLDMLAQVILSVIAGVGDDRDPDNPDNPVHPLRVQRHRRVRQHIGVKVAPPLQRDVPLRANEINIEQVRSQTTGAGEAVNADSVIGVVLRTHPVFEHQVRAAAAAVVPGETVYQGPQGTRIEPKRR